MELWDAADQNKVGTGKAHPVQPGICPVWELPHMEGIVCVFALHHGNSAGSGQVRSCGSRQVTQVWESVTGRELCPACAVDPRGGRSRVVDAKVHFLLPGQVQSEELK